MYEIIANPKDYAIGNLVEGMGATIIDFPEEERKKWAGEIGIFAEKLNELADKSKKLQALFSGTDVITATPASLKTFKLQLFTINDSLNTVFNIAGTLEREIVNK